MTLVGDNWGPRLYEPLRVTARIRGAIATSRDGLCLDGPLQYGAFCRWQAAGGDRDTLPPIGGPVAVDFALPVAQWRFGDHWGWHCSHACDHEWAFSEPLSIRSPSPHSKMARLSEDGSVQTSAGRYKSHDLAVETWTPAAPLVWYVLGCPDGVRELLEHVTSIGARRGVGLGAVDAWTVETVEEDHSIEREGVLMRRMPYGYCDGPEGYGPLRAPSWHRSRWGRSVESPWR